MADDGETERPRAFRLPKPDEGEAPRRGRAVVIEEAGPAEDAAPALEPARRRFGWASALVSALGGLLAISLALWVQDAIINAIRSSDVLGVLALALALVILVAAIVLIVRFLRGWLRERRIGRLKASAAAALASRSTEQARTTADGLVRLQASRPETAAGRARFAAALPAMTDARDILALAERELIEPLDRIAADEIAKAARQVSLVTAVSPRALIDLVFVVFAGARLIRRIAAIYGGRPSALGLLGIARSSIEHLLVTGGLAAGHAVIQQVIGQGLAARLSAKLGEGVLNGLMTARFGLAALTVCRPMPFVESAPPTLSDVAAGLMTGSQEEQAEQDPTARERNRR